MKGRGRRRASAASLTLLSLACGSPDPPPPASVCEDAEELGRATAAITAGAERSPLGLSQREMDAVVALRIGDEPDLTLCSGVLTAARAVLTAQHCVRDVPLDGMSVSVGRVVETSESFRVRTVTLSPAEDLAVLELEDAVPAGLASPLSVLGPGSGELAPFGVIAGFGLTAAGSSGIRLFAAVDIVGLDATRYTTSAAPSSGACLGDSGGPLLMRDERGAPAVAGVLSSGSATCRSDDEYVRLDVLADWVSPFLAPGEPECGDLGTRGSCAWPRLAVWCDSGALVREECEEGEACGWDQGAPGFRCLPSGSDPCAGVTELGRCASGARALRCADGVLLERACAECGRVCGRRPESGRVGCVEGASE